MASEKDSNVDKKTVSLHTLESDLASVVNDKNYGGNIIKIVTDPNKKPVTDKKEEVIADSQNNNNINTNKKNKNIYIKLFLYFILLIILSAMSYFGYVYYKLIFTTITPYEDSLVNNDLNTVGEDTQSTSTIIINNNDLLNSEIIQSSDFSKLNRLQIISEINKIKQLLIDKNIINNNNISINTNLTIVQFFEKIRYSGNESFLRSIGASYTFGFYSLKDNQFQTYLLLDVENFDLSFKSILEWEKYMPIDLKDIFIGNTELKSTSTEPVSTNTDKIVKNYSKKNTIVFVDKILKNQDIREYVNNENNINIIYGFVNNKYLLITSGETSFLSIKDRLLKENITR